MSGAITMEGANSQSAADKINSITSMVNTLSAAYNKTNDSMRLTIAKIDIALGYGEEVRYVGYVPNVGIFVLFQVTESKDVFGIGIAETKNQDRQIIQFGFDKSDNYYKFIFGGED